MQNEMTGDLSRSHYLARIVSPLLDWYDREARELPWRKANDPYATWISEIMLQQTRIEAVKPYFDRFMQEIPTIADLAKIEEVRLLKLWEGLGYYSRARNLKRTAQILVAQYNGRLPRSYEALLTLPGIGAYTAGAIASIAYDIPVPAVDGNVMRVVSRILAVDVDIADLETKRSMTRWLTMMMPYKRSGDFNQALMELGQEICLPIGKARCDICPIQMHCEAYADDVVDALPIKAAKKKRRIEKRTVWIASCGDRIAIRRRDENGLLARMWEFPNEEGMRSVEKWREELVSRGWQVERIKSAGTAKHIFTHLEWHMKGYRIELAEIIDDWHWVREAELEAVYPIPTAFRAFQERLTKEVQK